MKALVSMSFMLVTIASFFVAQDNGRSQCRVSRADDRIVGISRSNHTICLPIHKERLEKSKKELENEAVQVVKEAGKLECVVSSNRGFPRQKYYTLPNRKKAVLGYRSVDKKRVRRNSLELENSPTRVSQNVTVPNNLSTSKSSALDISKKTDIVRLKKSNLRPSISDAANIKSKSGSQKNKDKLHSVLPSDSERTRRTEQNKTKKQSTPIVKVRQRKNHLRRTNEDNKENENNNEYRTKYTTSATKKYRESDNDQFDNNESLRKYRGGTNEVSCEKIKQTVKHDELTTRSVPEIVIIDLDKAEQISNKENSKTKAFSKKFRFLNTRKTSTFPKIRESKNINVNSKLSAAPTRLPTTNIQDVIKILEKAEETRSNMIHSSQLPTEKPPLTKGRTVDTMVKRLSSDSSTSPPPKTNVLVTPNVSVQHNHNQPFSYTRGLSPEKYLGNEFGSPVIYAQVVCSNGVRGPSKQTVHTVYTSNIKKHPHHSDSDEGLGYEEHFNRKYNPLESSISKNSRNVDLESDEYFMESGETSTSPKMKTTYFNEYSYDKMFANVERGKADGMDSKRRESLSESIDNENTRLNGPSRNTEKSDWSARRDLLESRINQRLNDRIGPFSPPNHSNITEPSSYFRIESASPVGFTEKYNSETKIDVFGGQYTDHTLNKKYFGDRKDDEEYITNERYHLDHQLKDYRSSPESRRFETSHNKSKDRFTSRMEREQYSSKGRNIYQSNPEIHKRINETPLEDSYHDSLRREKRIFKSERYSQQSDSDRKDKFGDSGIENDIKRHFADSLQRKSKKIYGIRNTESEDEGFASSLLIANEKQHAEEALNPRKNRSDYETDAQCEREEYEYRKRRTEYVPRERSIDDGSHYDPRIDKDFQNERRTLNKYIEKKPPKPGKKSGLEKVKQLFMGSNKKKKETQTMVREEDLRSRYEEYRGSTEHLEPHMKKKEIKEQNVSYEYRNRSRLPTPKPEVQKNGYNHRNISDSNTSHTGWFKSLDRLSIKKNRKDEKNGNLTSAEEEPTPKVPPTKNLRFFGDSLRQRSITGTLRSDLSGRERIKSQSSRDLHNISEEIKPSRQKNGLRKNNHKSMLNIDESDRETNRSMKSSLKPPVSPSYRSRDPPRRDERGKRSKNEVISPESSTEGDSSQQSQQSQRSVVYLHAATVGDIPRQGFLKNSPRAASREELNSYSSKIQPRVKTLSRSFSMLAPWKPRHYRESMDIDYSQYPKPAVPKNGKYEQKVSKNGTSRNSSSSTLKKKAHETKRSNQNTSILDNYRSRSKENISSSQTLNRSDEERSRIATSTLYKKKDRFPRENSRYSKEKDDRKISSKSASVESLGGYSRTNRSREGNREVSRSISMPRDPEKSAGWFKMGRKSNRYSTSQRL